MQIAHQVLALCCVAPLVPACMPDGLPGDILDDEGALDEGVLDDSAEPPEHVEEFSFVFTVDGSTQPTTIEAAAALELAAQFEPGVSVERLAFWADDELILDSPDAFEAWWVAASAEQNGSHRFVARAWSDDGRQAEFAIEVELALPAPGKAMWQLGASELAGGTRAIASLGREIAVLDDEGVGRVSDEGETLWRVDLPFRAHVIASSSFSSTLHALGVDDGKLVDGQVDAGGELTELVALGEALAGLQLDSIDVDASRLALVGAWAQGTWIGVFGFDGTPRWSSSLELGEAAMRSVVLVPDGSFTVVDVVSLDDAGHAELQRHDEIGTLELAVSLAPGSRSLGLVRDGDAGVIVGTRDVQGNAQLHRISNEGELLGGVMLYDAQTLALARWRGHEGVQVSIGGPAAECWPHHRRCRCVGRRARCTRGRAAALARR